jgi:hypothetical protein
VRSNDKRDEKVRVDDCGKKNCSKGASNKHGKSGLLHQLTYQNVIESHFFMMIASLLFWKLATFE